MAYTQPAPTIDQLPAAGTYEAADDSQLLGEMAAGVPAALEAFYTRHARIAYTLAYRLVDDATLAEDVVQEAFLAVWRQAATFDSTRGTAQAWLCGIVRHRAIDTLRRRRTQLCDGSALLPEALGVGPHDVERDVLCAMENRRLHAAVRALPPAQRQAVELAFFGHLTHHEIAAHLGLPLGTVKGRLRLALRKLQTFVAGEGIVIAAS